ncbi:MAG: 50S ribosomal protein L23 [Candidatus Saccharimonadia bacterium]
MSNFVILPRISEKAIMLAERNSYVFEVPILSNKIEIARAIEQAFKVEVTSVNTITHKGKSKRFKKILGQERDTKKAIVTVKKGQSIALFEGAK